MPQLANHGMELAALSVACPSFRPGLRGAVEPETLRQCLDYYGLPQFRINDMYRQRSLPSTHSMSTRS
jgi:hypothetical protein